MGPFMQVDLEKIKKLPPDVRKDFMKMALKLNEKKKISKVNSDFLSFTKHIWPEFIEGRHHKIIAKKFNEMAEGKLKRLIVNMPPRHTKSEFASSLLPAWMIGRNPKLKIIQTTHTGELAIRFGRKAKTLMDSPEYKEVFETRLREDSQAAGRWETAQGGEYFAAGVGGAITGRGADLLIIDDPHSEQDALNMTALERAYEWYTSGPRQRLQPGGAIVCVMTRWNTKDLTGMLLEKEPENWEHICLPSELSNDVKPIELKENYTDGLLFPERLSRTTLESFKTGLGSYGFSGQYLQIPSPSDGGIFKEAWFNTIKELPESINKELITWDFFLDTAYTNKQDNDATAMLCGAFYNNELYIKEVKAVRLEFPELIKEIQKFSSINGYTNKSRIYIEPKASGKSIVQMLKRSTGLNVVEDKPPTQDKISRANSISAFVESGRVNLLDGRYINDFMNELKAFPNASHDDMVDVLIMAIDRNTNRRKKVRAFA